MYQENASVLEQIAEVLEKRKSESTENSYVASLYASGDHAIKGKIMEEAREVVNVDRDRHRELVHEISDLWFHCQVLLAHRNIHVREVFSELRKRFGISGHEEKKRRKDNREATD